MEDSFHRYKAILGREMKARTLAGQRVEARLGYRILNTMASLGLPESYRVARPSGTEAATLPFSELSSRPLPHHL